jgi:O-antigen/teichoic acid export membrane protein
MFLFIKKLFTNKITFYLITRYITYFIQFLFSILIALKLGPYYFGIWGFILLILNYFSQINFGISYSINVILVQIKNDVLLSNKYISTAYYLTGILSILVILIALYYYLIGISFLDKYELHSSFYIISIIAILTYINNLTTTIFRVKNKIYEIAFYQSIIPFLTLSALFFADDKALLNLLLVSLLIGQLLSIAIYSRGKVISLTTKPEITIAKDIVIKGFSLFIYNLCFYFIVISTRTIISYFYEVEEFGYFSFSFTLANSAIFLLDAVAFLIFPKVIDKLSSKDYFSIEANLSYIRVNYITLSHSLMYVAIAFFPMFIHFLPVYSGTIMSFNFIALTLMLYTNCFGYNTLLIAQNKEKTIALIAFVTLSINILLGISMVVFLQLPYMYIILSTMLSYLLYSFLLILTGRRLLHKKSSIKDYLSEAFPLSLMIPFLLTLTFSVYQWKYIGFISIILFLYLNRKKFIGIKKTISELINKPSIINI